MFHQLAWRCGCKRRLLRLGLRPSSVSAAYTPGQGSRTRYVRGRGVPKHIQTQTKHRQKSETKTQPTALFEPIPHTDLKANYDAFGEELTGRVLSNAKNIGILNDFASLPIVKELAAEQGITGNIYKTSQTSFKKFIVNKKDLPTELYITLNDIASGAAVPEDLFPSFIWHAEEIYPHLKCMPDLKQISDLTQPVNWYHDARNIVRKVIFHAGPTNSGKTYHALERFTNSNSGVYCGPLKMLATEVFKKSNEKGTKCDLVTGEERKIANPNGQLSKHIACTVEMTSINTQYDVAVIDEIQMIRDSTRGWAWTRALLGVCAKEVHVCGEMSAIPLVQSIVQETGDLFEVRNYERLTKLNFETKAVESITNIRPGDCIVCFNKNDIYNITMQLQKLRVECAVIYGSLPPGTKAAQAEKFNDPELKCKVLVATDAIGMGLNLSIQRLIFYAVMKTVPDRNGNLKMQKISKSQALQIAGRAGRYGTRFEEGYVTTFHQKDLSVLKDILKSQDDHSQDQAGLHPTDEQLELFSYQLPHTSLSKLVDIFTSVCLLDYKQYFLCNMDNFKVLSDVIEHVPLPLKVRYTFCCAPIDPDQAFSTHMFLQFALHHSKGIPVTFDWIRKTIKSPFERAKSLNDIIHMEIVFDCLDVYLWFSYRMPDIFPHSDEVRQVQQQLDGFIKRGINKLATMIKSQSENKIEVGQHEQLEEDLKPEEDLKQSNFRSERKNFVPGRLTNYLLNQRVLTPEMVKTLQEEFLKGNENQSDSQSSENIQLPKNGTTDIIALDKRTYSATFAKSEHSKQSDRKCTWKVPFKENVVTEDYALSKETYFTKGKSETLAKSQHSERQSRMEPPSVDNNKKVNLSRKLKPVVKVDSATDESYPLKSKLQSPYSDEKNGLPLTRFNPHTLHWKGRSGFLDEVSPVARHELKTRRRHAAVQNPGTSQQSNTNERLKMSGVVGLSTDTAEDLETKSGASQDSVLARSDDTAADSETKSKPSQGEQDSDNTTTATWTLNRVFKILFR